MTQFADSFIHKRLPWRRTSFLEYLTRNTIYAGNQHSKALLLSDSNLPPMAEHVYRSNEPHEALLAPATQVLGHSIVQLGIVTCSIPSINHLLDNTCLSQNTYSTWNFFLSFLFHAPYMFWDNPASLTEPIRPHHIGDVGGKPSTILSNIVGQPSIS